MTTHSSSLCIQTNMTPHFSARQNGHPGEDIAIVTFQKQLVPLQNSFDIFDTNYGLLTRQENNQEGCAALQTAAQRVLWIHAGNLALSAIL